MVALCAAKRNRRELGISISEWCFRSIFFGFTMAVFGTWMIRRVNSFIRSSDDPAGLGWCCFWPSFTRPSACLF